MSKKKGARALLTVLCVVLGLVLAGMIAGTVYFQMLMGKIGRVDDTDETYSDEQIQEILKEENAEENTAPELDEDDVIIGACAIGNPMSEIIPALAVAVERRLSCNDMSKVVFPHPTVAEIFREAIINEVH